MSALDAHRVPASESIARVADYVNKKASEINAGEFSSFLKPRRRLLLPLRWISEMQSVGSVLLRVPRKE